MNPPTPLQSSLSPDREAVPWMDLDVELIDTARYPGAFSSDEMTPWQKAVANGEAIPASPQMNGKVKSMFSPREPYYAIKHQRLEHMTVIYLKAQGLTNTEIAAQTGWTTVAISNLLRQPWAQEQVLEIVHQNGGNAVQQCLNANALKAVQRLVREMDNDDARPSERIVAADKLLDRLYGKPNQPIEHRAGDTSQMSDEELEAIVKRGTSPGGEGSLNA
jgi:hypothetical protein